MRPDPKRTQLEYEYKTALRDAISGAGEVALAHAYELGRVAAAGGVGVVDLVSIHQTAMLEVLGDHAPPPEVGQFVTEALSPFEMTHRGFREAHERLESAYKELEAFSYSVSHDLRAPLRTISAFTQALAEDLKFQLDDKARDHLRIPVCVRSAGKSQPTCALVGDATAISLGATCPSWIIAANGGYYSVVWTTNGPRGPLPGWDKLSLGEKLALATDQCRRLHREVRRSVLERLQRRKLLRQPADLELVQPLRLA